MPALGNRGVVSPQAIRKAAAKPAPKARSLPVQHSAPKVYAPKPSSTVRGSAFGPSPSKGTRLQPKQHYTKVTPQQERKIQSRGAPVARSLLGETGHILSSIPALVAKTEAGGKVVTKGQAKQARLHGAVVQSPDITIAGGHGAYGDLLQHYSDFGNALANNPTGTLQHTAQSMVPFANAMVTGPARMVIGAATGHLHREAGAFWTGIERQIQQELSHGRGNQERIEKEGGLSELLNAAAVAGGTTRLLSGAARIAVPADRFEAAAGALKSVNEFRREQALARAGGQSVPLGPVQELPKGVRRQAFVHEILHGERPNLRTAPGSERASRTPGSGLRPQERSKNAVVAAAQHALDQKRLESQVGSLNRVWEARVKAHLNPHMAGDELGEIYAHQLAHDTMRGEVMPLIQRGPDALGKTLGHSPFLGANRSQRIGVDRPVNTSNIDKERQLHVLGAEVRKGTDDLSKVQKKLLTMAKEGKLPLHDPARAEAMLRDIHEAAKRGQVGVTMGIKHIREGADLARETGSILKHIEKHGAESVLTPEFARAVKEIPDERVLSDKNPVLARAADHKVVRKFLPQVAQLHDIAELHPERPDSAATKIAVRQIHQDIERGHSLRARANGYKTDIEHTPEGRAWRETKEARVRAEVLEKKARAAHLPVDPARVAKAVERTRAAQKAEIAARKVYNKLKKDPVELHNRADEAFTHAKNLADDLATSHHLPTDRAYIPHVKGLKETRGMSGQVYSPADYKKWGGILQRTGRLNTHHSLVLRGIERTARDIHAQQVVNEIHDKFSVKLPKRNMTVKEIHEWMANTGRDPADWNVVHFGKLRENIEGMANAQNLRHLNTDESSHATALGDALKQASEGLPLTEKGAQLIPKAAYDELQAFYKRSPGAARVWGRTKGQVSKLMLGLSLPWAVGMYPAYALQSLAGGAGPVDFLSNLKWYRGLSEADKRRFDLPMGIDSPYMPGSHGIDKERVGTPTSLQGLQANMRVMRESPLGRALSHANPADQLLNFERHARRGSRINVSVKGVKNEAIRQMVSDMGDAQKSMNSFEVRLKKLQFAGRRAPDDYMKKALQNQDAMERVAEHTEHVLGNFQHMSAFEKNIVNRTFMFYPWVRYSLKLLAHTLPTRHPYLLALGLKLGQMEHRELHELLGTDPELGTLYLGAPQPGKRPEDRKFSSINVKDINPTLNGVVEALSGTQGANVGQILDAVPPYIASAIGYAANKDLFTDKPLTGGKLGQASGIEHGRPALGRYALHEAEQYFFPTRVAGHQLQPTRPESSEGAPAFGLSRPKEYAKRSTERKIQKEPHGHELLSELFPLIPKPAERIPQLVEKEKKEARSEKKLAKKQKRYDNRSNNGWGPEAKSQASKPSSGGESW